MKTCALLVMSAFMMSAARPAFAMTHQERLACAWTAGNCLDEAQILEKRITEIKRDIQKNANGSPEEEKILENKLREAMDQLKRIEGK